MTTSSAPHAPARIEFPAPRLNARTSPSWTNDAFDADAWRANDANPSQGRAGVITFSTIPYNFRTACKEFLSAMDQGVDAGYRRVRSSGTAVLLAGFLRHLATHLESKGVHSFLAAIAADVEEAQLRHSGLLDGAPVTSSHARRFLATLGHLHRLGPAGSGTISDGLSFDPSQRAVNIGLSRNLKPTGSTPMLSEDTARLLLTMAVDWVENKFEATKWILAAHDLYSQAEGNNLSKARRFMRENPGFEASLNQARTTFGGPLVGLLPRRLTPSIEERGITDIELDLLWLGQVARSVQLAFQGFCYVVCAGFNGWRASEIMSIEWDSLSETPSGHVLTTKIRKTAANPRQSISRPVPPIVALAVKRLSELNARAAWPTTRRDRDVEGGSIFRTSVGGLTNSLSINDSLSASWTHFTGDEQRITTHQFRRFFAYFFLRRHQGNLDAVRRHFRHVSRDMVWAYAKDALNASYLTLEKQGLAQDIAKSVVFGEGHVSVGVAQDLKAVCDTLRLGAKVLTVEDAATYIDRQIKKFFLDVQAMEWGYCLLQGGDKGGACEGQVGPIEDRSEPSVCGRCKFFCTGPENEEFWRQSAGLHEEIMAHPKSTRLMKSESERFVATAERILKRHDKPSNVEVVHE
ncbi:hypothetical protein B9Z44_12375 [Limnohabitans curvus]|jgi:integrase|uniref:Tyr recombinase domain-containing protein n=1 Tax=Limnohabitans curvus TaxID=323423 RepID=A0A315EQV4_9BURK|nr:site-specific integrase [Limnohabitans curvus]PUE60296.1 hypothetical protein B9Z44_12375 [Limnohabitans curvus]